MKSTGVIRRIDDLGRVVIPKEIRKNLRIKEGDNLEVYVQNDEIVLKKYSVINKINEIAQELTDAVYTFLKYNIFITDTDTIIAASGNLKKEFINKNLNSQAVELIKKRERKLDSYFKEFNFIEDKIVKGSCALSTIIVNGEAIGMIVILSEDEKLGDREMQIASIVSSFITKYLEQ